MKKRLLFSVSALTASWLTAAAAAPRPDVTVPQLARESRTIVVAKAVSISPEWRTSPHGDQLIVSQVALQVEETIKGAPGRLVLIEVEGGTIDGLTMAVSSQTPIKKGDRAIFFLDEAVQGVHVPHLKGLGVMKLDETNRVQGSAMGLDQVRRLALAAR